MIEAGLATDKGSRVGEASERLAATDHEAVSVETVSKSFGAVRAVNNVSFETRRREIFGLVGPNGAGKTTLIRMIMNIFRPDSGSIRILGSPVDKRIKQRLGYLPEERGLYVKQKVRSVLEYFAKLKGIPSALARPHVAQWLERLEISDLANRRIHELSKGNQQKVQLVTALLGSPEIIVLDEPFSGLDPVNTRVLVGLIRELAADGRTILFSSHQMTMVEKLCQRVLMINRGEAVLYGNLDDIKKVHSESAVVVRSDIDMSACPLIHNAGAHENGQKVLLNSGVSVKDLMSWLVANGADVSYFEESPVTLEDIYVNLVEGNK